MIQKLLIFLSILPSMLCSAASPNSVRSILQTIEQRAQESETDELFVWKDGKVLVDVVRKPEIKLNIFSITKSLVSLGVGIAWDQKKITSLDLPIVTYFPQLKGTPKQTITLRHLLNHTSGIYSPFGYKVDWQNLLHAKDIVEFTFAEKQSFPPGEAYFYNNKATGILPTLLERITGVNFLTFMKENLFTPLGITEFDWKQDSAGNYFGMSEVKMSAHDLAKIGQLILQKGMWGQKRIISTEWIEMIGTSSQTFHPRVGLLWWRSPHAWASVDDPNFCVYWDKSLIDSYKKHNLTPSIINWVEKQGDQCLTLKGMYRQLGDVLSKTFDQEFAKLALDEMLPLYRVKAKVEYGIAAQGWFGQQLVIMPDKNLVAVRICDESGKPYSPKYFFSDLPELLRQLD